MGLSVKDEARVVPVFFLASLITIPARSGAATSTEKRKKLRFVTTLFCIRTRCNSTCHMVTVIVEI
jgi:hypothetical protein